MVEMSVFYWKPWRGVMMLLGLYFEDFHERK